jgi:hypothetical protein
MFDTSYISKNVPLCPTEAAGITDLWYRQLDEVSVGSRFVRAADRLWLSGEVGPEAPEQWRIRHIPGILWVRCRPVRVEFEVSAWSATTTTVALRPQGWSSVIDTERFGEAAFRAVEKLAHSLTLMHELTLARTASFRSVRDVLVERKLQWPAASERNSGPFVPAPAPRRRPAQVTVDDRLVQSRSS